jgi:two-component sensor histidine kinase
MAEWGNYGHSVKKLLPAAPTVAGRVVFFCEAEGDDMPEAYALFMRTAQLSTVPRYAASLSLVLIAAVLRWALAPWFDGHDQYFLFEFAVALGAIFFDHGSSFVATAVSAVIAIYFFVPPAGFALRSADTVVLLAFISTCIVLSLSAEIMRTLAEKLARSEKENEVLYNELQHRSRNNLQIISSSIAMQMSRTRNAEIREALQSVSDRIMSVGRLDHLLHGPGSGGTVDLHTYLESLTEDLSLSLAAQRPVTLSCKADSHTLDRETASMLGIAVNELVTNALKHAFPGGVAGNIGIRVCAIDGELELAVEDNGRGCPPESVSGTGWRLLRSLISKHKGRLSVEDAAPGCRVVIRLPYKG